MEAYLDNSATTRCLPEAAELMAQLLTQDYGNPSSMHRMGVTAENYMNDTKKKIAKTLKVQEKEIYFTSGGTEANNLAVIGAAMANMRAGKHVITTVIEHASVANPAEWLAQNGFEVTYLSVDKSGCISLNELQEAIRRDTILVSIMHVNNEIGTIQPVEEAGHIIKEQNPQTLFHVDAVQSYGKMYVYPKKWNIDLLSLSGHKIHGPKGSGCLYMREKTKIRPLFYGGGQQKGIRSGTENVPAIVGFGAAAEKAYVNLEENAEHMYALRAHALDKLAHIPGVSINGAAIAPTEPDCAQAAPHIVSVSVEGVRAEVLLHTLEDKGIYISSGSACSSNKPSVSHTLKGIGLKDSLLDSTVRLSFCADTTIEEVDYAIEVMGETIPMLQKYTRH